MAAPLSLRRVGDCAILGDWAYELQLSEADEVSTLPQLGFLPTLLCLETDKARTLTSEFSETRL